MCAAYNNNRGPVCCDIQLAVPVAYNDEWAFLSHNTDLWHPWQSNESQSEQGLLSDSLEDINPDQILIACKGAAHCQRGFRAISCRQFPFFPYITRDFRIIGMTYDWHYENHCWVISNLDQVSTNYRQQFIAFFDRLFDIWPEEMESYAILSQTMRTEFLLRKKRIPILHRNGFDYLLSPGSDRMQKVSAEQYLKFHPYK